MIDYLIDELSDSDKETEIPVDVNSAANSTDMIPMEVETVKESKPKNKIATKLAKKVMG